MPSVLQVISITGARGRGSLFLNSLTMAGDAEIFVQQEEILLAVRNLTVAFGSRVVLLDLTFRAARGGTLAIIIRNGSGKTVLLKALLNLVPY